jgi:pyruvate dehydrogenase E2 component (dihydrolipoamide acetyltransferase)
MLTLTLSCDHRAVDGAIAAQFLDALSALIEEPLRAL